MLWKWSMPHFDTAVDWDSVTVGGHQKKERGRERDRETERSSPTFQLVETYLTTATSCPTPSPFLSSSPPIDRFTPCTVQPAKPASLPPSLPFSMCFSAAPSLLERVPL